MKTIQEIFIANLKRLRGERTQAVIAEIAGIPLRSYQNAEINGAIPQGPNLAAIAKAFGVPETHLFVDSVEFVPVGTSVPFLKMRAIELIAAFDEPEPLEGAITFLEGMLGPRALNDAIDQLKKFTEGS